MNYVEVIRVKPDNTGTTQRVAIWLESITWPWSDKPIVGRPRRPFDWVRDRWEW